MVLDSDVPNVVGFDPIITRDIQRKEQLLCGVEVIYRGDVTDPSEQIGDTRSAFTENGWTLVSQQARGKTSTMYFAKDSRSATVQIALNQIDPMMSPALLRVGPAGSSGTTPQSSAARASPGGIPRADSGSRYPEGFAPPPPP